MKQAQLSEQTILEERGEKPEKVPRPRAPTKPKKPVNLDNVSRVLEETWDTLAALPAGFWQGLTGRRSPFERWINRRRMPGMPGMPRFPRRRLFGSNQNWLTKAFRL